MFLALYPKMQHFDTAAETMRIFRSNFIVFFVMWFSFIFRKFWIQKFSCISKIDRQLITHDFLSKIGEAWWIMKIDKNPSTFLQHSKLLGYFHFYKLKVDWIDDVFVWDCFDFIFLLLLFSFRDSLTILWHFT